MLFRSVWVRVWVVGGANALDSQGWKRPWELWGVGLRLKEHKGPRRVPHPPSQRAGEPHLGAQQASWARVGGANALCSSPTPPKCPSHLPLLIFLTSGVPILSGLHFSSPFHPPTSYAFTWGFFLSPGGVRVPHQQPAGTLVVGRC